jgi:hypothetical protein
MTSPVARRAIGSLTTISFGIIGVQLYNMSQLTVPLDQCAIITPKSHRNDLNYAKVYHTGAHFINPLSTRQFLTTKPSTVYTTVMGLTLDKFQIEIDATITSQLDETQILEYLSYFPDTHNYIIPLIAGSVFNDVIGEKKRDEIVEQDEIIILKQNIQDEFAQRIKHSGEQMCVRVDMAEITQVSLPTLEDLPNVAKCCDSNANPSHFREIFGDV